MGADRKTGNQQQQSNNTTQLLHGTCIAVGENAILLRGPSGAGKSDLALRCLMTQIPRSDRFELVSDDQVRACNRHGQVIVSPPDAIAGKLEVRGIGIVTFHYRPRGVLRLVVDLVDPQSVGAQIERMPEPDQSVCVSGVQIAYLKLAPFEPSAPIKVNLALQQLLSNREE